MHEKTLLLNKAQYNPPIFRVHHAINGEEAGRADELEVCCRQPGDVTCNRALCRNFATNILTGSTQCWLHACDEIVLLQL